MSTYFFLVGGGKGESLLFIFYFFVITSAFFVLILDLLTLVFLNIFVQFLQVEFILNKCFLYLFTTSSNPDYS